MTHQEEYDAFLQDLGIYDVPQRENIIGTLYQLAHLIIEAYGKEKEETGNGL